MNPETKEDSAYTFKKASIKLAVALKKELESIELPQEEAGKLSTDELVLRAARAVSKKIDAGVAGLFDPTNPSDNLIISLSKMEASNS
jgi:hypothetical protein